MKWHHHNTSEVVPGIPTPLALDGWHPSTKLHVIGVTGTNGKTTVAYLLGEVLKAAGYKPFVLGTLNSGTRELSTPEAHDILNFMTAHLDHGGTHFIMEVTSEGIHQSRIQGVEFDIKILTNITQDHLDYHKTFAAYERVKLDFMSDGPAHRIYPAQFETEEINFPTQLLGDFNHLNVKAAVCALRHLGIPEPLIRATLAICPAPSGRLEHIDEGQPYLVLVDYAHTPDGLKNVLETLRKVADSRGGKLLVLFGCGGNRDRGKRPQMGKIASEIADFIVVTDDNPRSECSTDIITEISTGIDTDFRDFALIQDRRIAIEFIINRSKREDVVLLAGKGHETYQIINSGTVQFDDREQASEMILRRQCRNSQTHTLQ